MRNRVLGLTLGCTLALILLEFVLRLLPVSTASLSGYYNDPLVLSYPPGHSFVVSTGWAFENAHTHRANNLGFLDTHDYLPDARGVAVIGDSFVEANMLAAPDRLVGRLNALSPKASWWGLGGPGSSLLDYAHRAEWAAKTLNARRFVFVIEAADVVQSRCGSGHVHGVCIDAASGEFAERTIPGPDATKRVLRHSALAQYLFSQLKVSPERLRALFAPARKPGPRPAEIPNAAALDESVLRRFEAQLTALDPDSVVFVLSAPSNPAQRRAVDALRAMAHARHWSVVDTVPLFEDAWRRTKLSLRVSPSDTHWNRRANTLVAEQVLAALAAQPEGRN
jgi:hypothetical protein